MKPKQHAQDMKTGFDRIPPSFYDSED